MEERGQAPLDKLEKPVPYLTDCLEDLPAWRYLSTSAAILRPSAITHTIKEAPRRSYQTAWATEPVSPFFVFSFEPPSS